jgi:hypothetical protein
MAFVAVYWLGGSGSEAQPTRPPKSDKVAKEVRMMRVERFLKIVPRYFRCLSDTPSRRVPSKIIPYALQTVDNAIVRRVSKKKSKKKYLLKSDLRYSLD